MALGLGFGIVSAGFFPNTIEIATKVPAIAQANTQIVSPQNVFGPAALAELLPLSVTAVDEPKESQIQAESLPAEEKTEDVTTDNLQPVPSVPFYSQFNDISSPEWKKVGCGIASLAMLIDYYEPKVSVDELLDRGISEGAYIDDAGWSHAGLISLSKRYGLSGETHDLRGSSMDDAFASLEDELKDGPVMASVHYTFTPTNPIPHLVVIRGVEDGQVFYNDPAEPTGGGSISIAQFQGAWKKRYIDIRPVS